MNNEAYNKSNELAVRIDALIRSGDFDTAVIAPWIEEPLQDQAATIERLENNLREMFKVSEEESLSLREQLAECHAANVKHQTTIARQEAAIAKKDERAKSALSRIDGMPTCPDLQVVRNTVDSITAIQPSSAILDAVIAERVAPLRKWLQHDKKCDYYCWEQMSVARRAELSCTCGLDAALAKK